MFRTSIYLIQILILAYTSQFRVYFENILKKNVHTLLSFALRSIVLKFKRVFFQFLVSWKAGVYTRKIYLLDHRTFM